MNLFNLRRLLAVVLKELSQLRRDRLTFAMIIGIPTMQLLLFGYAINLDVRNLPAAVVDQAHTSQSRQVLDQLQQSQVLTFVELLPTPEAANRALQSGEVKMAVVIPADFEQRLAEPGRPAIQVLVDGSDQVVQQAARQLSLFPVREFLSGRDVSTPAPQIQVATYYNPQRQAPLNTVPGLIGVILTMTLVMFTAIALVREREHGNLEFLITTPLSSAELTIGKVLPFVAIGLVQTTLILLLGKLIFQVPVHGSLLDLYAAALVFIIASLALGIFISTLVSSQFQAMQAAIFSFLPQLLLSGFMFPYEGMPRLAQWIAEVMPLTHFIRLVRGIMVRGAGFADLWPDLLALLAFALVTMVIATLRVHKRLD
ncbi:MAG: ABC transporter permease [Alcanivorax sp.]|nr:ABC transporter permease [Alcanivorax sp.]